MKYLLSLLLAFLINLPNCGMVFSGEMNLMKHHSDREIQSMNMDEVIMDMPSHSDIGSGMYDCCPNSSKGIIERNIASSFSIEYIPTINRISSICFQDFIGINTRKYITPINRPDAPPDPSTYISLIGHSVKNLN